MPKKAAIKEMCYNDSETKKHMNQQIAQIGLSFIVLLGVSILLFVLFRSVMLWYWKVNELLSVIKSIDKNLGIFMAYVATKDKEKEKKPNQ